MKVGLVSLGCAKNLVDSEMMMGLMKENGLEITSSPEEADIIIVNTCGFIKDSKEESIETILEMSAYHKFLVVTGCLVERYLNDLKKELPEVDLFIPIRDYAHFIELLSNYHHLPLKGELNRLNRVLATPSFTAYLKISEGCNNRCSYCAIPLIRGSFKSFKKEDILNEAKSLERRGVKELVVISQDTTRYGTDLYADYRIENLLKDLLKETSFEYIRLLYLYPSEISDALIELIGANERLTPYFDIPIQHASTKMLQSMNRRGNLDDLKNLFDKIRTKVKNPILRTTLIVGFPGETEDDFKILKEFVNEIQFDHLGVFTYSREEDTASYNMKPQVKKSLANKRKKELMDLQRQISNRKNKLRIGEKHRGIVTGYDHEKNLYTLRSYFNAPDDIDGVIYFSSNKNYGEGDIAQCRIVDSGDYDLYGVDEEEFSIR